MIEVILKNDVILTGLTIISIDDKAKIVEIERAECTTLIPFHNIQVINVYKEGLQ